MKKQLFTIIGLILGIAPTQAGHIALNSSEKSHIAEQRLAMIQHQLSEKAGELLMLERSLKGFSISEQTAGPALGARIAQLKQELLDYEKAIAVLQASIKALTNIQT